jgi:hypothetical protein
MRISVYDTYVHRPDGLQMHFDILVPSDLSNPETVLKFGQTYLAAKGLPPSILESEKCNFCHVEAATTAFQEEITTNGFAIIELENCC